MEEYIINPMWFYWVRAIANIGVFMCIVGIIGAILSLVMFFVSFYSHCSTGIATTVIRRLQMSKTESQRSHMTCLGSVTFTVWVWLPQVLLHLVSV